MSDLRPELEQLVAELSLKNRGLKKSLLGKEHALAPLMVEYTLLKKTHSLGAAVTDSKGSTSRASGGRR